MTIGLFRYEYLITDGQRATFNITPVMSRHRELGGASYLLLRLDADAIINGALDLLLATKVAFCGLHRDMPEQKLDLFELSTCNVTEPGACATQIVGRDLLNADFP